MISKCVKLEKRGTHPNIYNNYKKKQRYIYIYKNEDEVNNKIGNLKNDI
jgi:uncharacterized protein YcgL (UPF0745 family)